jgi:outer membrane protein OmpA-like peptidoglycan-associated protein
MARTAGRWRVVIAAVPEVVDAGALAPEAACTDDINRMLDTEAVGFVPGRAEFRRENAGALDQLAGIARRCDARVRLELAVNGDALAQARAAALADYLERAGVSRPQLAAIAYGPATGVEGMDTGAAVASDRPREFTVRERSER